MSPLSPLLDGYDQLILDLDGCVRVGDGAVPGSPEAIAALRAAGKRVAFATNNSWHSGEDQVQSLWGIGVQASLADVVTVGGAVQHLLAETRTGRTAFVIGSEVLHRHVADAGLTVVNGTPRAVEAEVVVVGGTDQFDYAAAARRGVGGAPLRRPAGHGPRPHPADARRPVAGHRVAGGGGRGGVGTDGGGGGQARGPADACRAGPPRRRAARSWWATGSTPTWPRPARPAWTRRSCSAARGPARPPRTGLSRWPRRRTLAELVGITSP